MGDVVGCGLTILMTALIVGALLVCPCARCFRYRMAWSVRGFSWTGYDYGYCCLDRSSCDAARRRAMGELDV